MEPPEVGPHPGQLATLSAVSIHGTRWSRRILLQTVSKVPFQSTFSGIATTMVAMKQGMISV